MADSVPYWWHACRIENITTPECSRNGTVRENKPRTPTTAMLCDAFRIQLLLTMERVDSHLIGGYRTAVGLVMGQKKYNGERVDS